MADIAEDVATAALGRLLWDEYPHVKRCVKRVLEENVVRREQAYSSALQRALDLYAAERAARVASGDALAVQLARYPDATRAFPCAVSAALFTENYDIQSLLVSQDPLVKKAEDFLRSAIERMARENRHACRFDTLLAEFMVFARQHRDRVVAPAASGTTLDALGMQPFRVRLSSESVVFPTHASWAAFVANKTLWQGLVGAPHVTLHEEAIRLRAPRREGGPFPPRRTRPAWQPFVRGSDKRSDDDKWSTVRNMVPRLSPRPHEVRGSDSPRSFASCLSSPRSWSRFDMSPRGDAFARTDAPMRADAPSSSYRAATTDARVRMDAPSSYRATAWVRTDGGMQERAVFLLAPDLVEWDDFLARHEAAALQELRVVGAYDEEADVLDAACVPFPS